MSDPKVSPSLVAVEFRPAEKGRPQTLAVTIGSAVAEKEWTIRFAPEDLALIERALLAPNVVKPGVPSLEAMADELYSDLFGTSPPHRASDEIWDKPIRDRRRHTIREALDAVATIAWRARPGPTVFPSTAVDAAAAIIYGYLRSDVEAQDFFELPDNDVSVVEARNIARAALAAADWERRGK